MRNGWGELILASCAAINCSSSPLAKPITDEHAEDICRWGADEEEGYTFLSPCAEYPGGYMFKFLHLDKYVIN